MPQYRHLAHLEDSRGIPGPRHGDLLDRAKPEGFGHCGRAVQLCEAKNVQTSGLIRVANCRLWDNNLVSNCLLLCRISLHFGIRLHFRANKLVQFARVHVSLHFLICILCIFCKQCVAQLGALL